MSKKREATTQQCRKEAQKEHHPRSVGEIYTVRTFMKVLVCVKVLQTEFTMESVPKLGIIQVFGGTTNKYGYLDQSIGGSALTIYYLARI